MPPMDAIIGIFDHEQDSTFQLKSMLDEIVHADTDAPIFIWKNKTDLDYGKDVTEMFDDKPVTRISAATGSGVHCGFLTVARKLIELNKLKEETREQECTKKFHKMKME